MQNCKNVGTLIQCGECDKWCVIYSKSKLSLQDKEELARFLDEIQYTLFNSMKNLLRFHIIRVDYLKGCLVLIVVYNVKNIQIIANIFHIVKTVAH